ncbi:MAG: DUF5671 domain-containing protein [Pseudomonadota bacterium]
MKLQSFVKESLEKGEDRAAIKSALITAGWRDKEITAALSDFADVSFPVAVPKPTPYLSAREAFFYLFFFILLGIVSVSLGGLLFSIIDILIPDGLESWRANRAKEGVRSGIAGLAIALPLFIWIGRILQVGRRNNPQMQRSRIRKWLTYISLVIAGCALVGDGISLLTSFLSGDATLRFVLKSVVVAAIAGGIFVYFIRDAEQGDEIDQAK